MSYINFKTLDKFLKDFRLEELLYLCAIKQQEEENIQEYYSLNHHQKLLDSGYIKTLKKGELRLDKKGTDFLRDIGRSEHGEDEEKLFEWLSNHYLKLDKEIGNPNRVKKLLKWFSDETGISKNNLVKLFIDFLSDEYVEEVSRVLEFTIFYPKKYTTDKGKTIAYEAKPDIYDSWLYKHYLKHRCRLDTIFE